jgi:hypothetical protein
MARRSARAFCLVLLAAAVVLSGCGCGGGGDEGGQSSIAVGLRAGDGAEGAERVNAGAGSSAFSEVPEALLASAEAVRPSGAPGSGWIPDVLVSDQPWNANNDGFQSMEADPLTGDLYMVYESWTNYATGTYQWCLCVRRSQDGGAVWSPEIWVLAYPVQINGVYPDMKEPDIAIDSDGVIWLVYTVFAYNGPARTVIDMQVFAQQLNIGLWDSGPWLGYMVTDSFGSPYNYHRLPSLAIHQVLHKPILATLTYNQISATQTSLVAWQWADGPDTQPWDGWLVRGPVSANYIQYPCLDVGSASNVYIASMYYYAPAGTFDMIVDMSTNDGLDWALVADYYDAGDVNSFYKPSMACTKGGSDVAMCAGTYTPNPSDQHQGRIGYGFSYDGTTWDGYLMTMSNYQRMPYVEEDIGGSMFGMSYRQEDGGPVYRVQFIVADIGDLSTWYGPETASDASAYPASNWFMHLALQYRPDGYAYPCVAWSDLRNAAGPITEYSNVHVVYSTPGATMTLLSVPSGLQLLVDSQPYTTPHTFTWPTGFIHQLEAPPTQLVGSDLYDFVSWSDGGAIAHEVLADGVDGSVTAYYALEQSFSIPLVEGWNLVSLPLMQANTRIEQVLASIAGQWDYAMAYVPGAADPWKSNHVARPDELDDLFNLDHTMGFWLRATQAGVTLNVAGTSPTSTQILLHTGWNLIGYPARDDATYTVGQLRAATGATIVEGFDVGAEYRTRTLPDTQVMKRGEGYWVQVLSDTTWTVDW